MLDNGQANRTESPLLVQILVWVLAISSHSLYDWAFLHSACSLSFFHALHSRRRRLLCVCDVRMFFRLKTFGGKQKKRTERKTKREQEEGKETEIFNYNSFSLADKRRQNSGVQRFSHSLTFFSPGTRELMRTVRATRPAFVFAKRFPWKTSCFCFGLRWIMSSSSSNKEARLWEKYVRVEMRILDKFCFVWGGGSRDHCQAVWMHMKGTTSFLNSIGSLVNVNQN